MSSPVFLLDGPVAWRAAGASLAILAIAHGGPMIASVALAPISSELGASRGAIALAGALTYAGAALGGMAAGWIASRFEIRWVVLFGGTMLATGLVISAHGGLVALQVGHGLFIGVLGNACLLAPLFAYVSEWFVRHRGAAIALVSSGQSFAGLIWPILFDRSVAAFGWRWTMHAYAIGAAGAVAVLALCFLKAPPRALRTSVAQPAGASQAAAARGAVMPVLMAAIFLCCVPMNMPLQHLVAFCGDVGVASRQGATMLALLLGVGLVARLFWGWICDRIGGLPTLVLSSLAQLVSLSGFVATQDESTLFLVSAAFGFGFTGLLPAYIVTIREHYPAREATWRIPAILLAGYLGMAAGGWGAGVAFDLSGSYRNAFGLGLAFNLANLALLVTLCIGAGRTGSPRGLAGTASPTR